MNPAAARERDGIVMELNAVIRELETSAAQLSAEKGIGAEACMHALYSMADRYRRVRDRLRSIT